MGQFHSINSAMPGMCLISDYDLATVTDRHKQAEIYQSVKMSGHPVVRPTKKFPCPSLNTTCLHFLLDTAYKQAEAPKTT